MASKEKERLAEECENIPWKMWGPYLSERQWATVREDYTEHGNAWEGVIHDHARSKAYRWGEDGIGGFSNTDQRICFSWAFWNGNDPILKERLFGLTGTEGNHGEDVKELYYYLDSTPSHSYMKMLYKYPMQEYPYAKMVEENSKRSRKEREFELMDTGLFDEDKYFDIFLEYAKNTPTDCLFKATAHNRHARTADLFILPTIWFRNTWSSGRDTVRPRLFLKDSQTIQVDHHLLGTYYMYFSEEVEEVVFTDNETNRERLYGIKNTAPYFKDAFHEYVINEKPVINTKQFGTKSAGIFRLKVPAKAATEVKVRLSNQPLVEPFADFDAIFQERMQDADEFYGEVQEKVDNKELRNIQRQAFAGMMWSKQFYYYNMETWLHGDPGRHGPPSNRKHGRNSEWGHLFNYHIISMPDKWEYPWYAAWDLAFHCLPLARIDAEFAKEQLLLLLNERYQHPNGQIPAYEWNFSDVNPPVHAWAVLRVYQIDKEMTGKGDLDFLQKAFHKLTINFTWWVNQKDEDGNNLFEGGFLGLDNIGVFDRNHQIFENSHLEQADSTSWMAMFSLNMLKISLELAVEYPVYQDMSIKFFEHFLYISAAMNEMGGNMIDLWDEEDEFYYDIIRRSDAKDERLKVRSMVGLIPLYAVEILDGEAYAKLPEFRKKLDLLLQERPKLTSLVSRWGEEGKNHNRLLSILRIHRMKRVLQRMLDTDEFLSPYGIRALSKYHEKHPYEFHLKNEVLRIEYLPGESDSSFFGGNSNWRGPIWFPVNYLLLESMSRFDQFYGESFKLEFPTGSEEKFTLQEISEKVCWRMFEIFLPDKDGRRPIYADQEKFQTDPHFKDHILFYEYFHADSGEGLGAAHQTGWTGLVAEMIHQYYN